MTDWMNKNRHTRRRTYRPPLRIFPAGWSRLDKIKAIALWLLVAGGGLFWIFRWSDSWGWTIISLLGYAGATLFAALIGPSSAISDDEE